MNRFPSRRKQFQSIPYRIFALTFAGDNQHLLLVFLANEPNRKRADWATPLGYPVCLYSYLTLIYFL